MFIAVAKNDSIGQCHESFKCEECCVFVYDGCNFVEILLRFGGNVVP